MPAIIARLLPVAILLLILFWLIQELNSLDKEKKDLEDHWFWGKVRTFREWRLSTDWAGKLFLYGLRVVIFLVAAGFIIYLFSSK